MNIEIANRLVQLRKNSGFSQEALAEKLGISRQAVSKWERAEASPDTDNLIMLAKLYKVSLDDLLMTDAEEAEKGTDGVAERQKYNEMEDRKDCDKRDEYVHGGFEGVHVIDKDGSEVHVGWDGIHVDERKQGDEVCGDKNGVYVNGEKYHKEWFKHFHHFPFAIIICVAYIIIGALFNVWHPGWLLFLLIPLWHSFWEAVRKENAHVFAYPVLAVVLYLCMGFFLHLWHPGWVVFLTIPVYYSLVSYLAEKDAP